MIIAREYDAMFFIWIKNINLATVTDRFSSPFHRRTNFSSTCFSDMPPNNSATHDLPVCGSFGLFKETFGYPMCSTQVASYYCKLSFPYFKLLFLMSVLLVYYYDWSTVFNQLFFWAKCTWYPLYTGITKHFCLTIQFEFYRLHTGFQRWNQKL